MAKIKIKLTKKDLTKTVLEIAIKDLQKIYEGDPRR